MNSPPDSFQSQFHRRWNHLHDPHVRALAWLLDAPDMLDSAAPRWNGAVATLPQGAAQQAADWLASLDRAPAALHRWLDLPPLPRLGRYAEKLLAFYFLQQGVLAAHGVQVRNEKSETIGEFDFLLRQDDALVHWEFATKFYLFHTGRPPAEPGVAGADYFVGPNLADTLGAKMDKILRRQLALGAHPAAQAVLPQPLVHACALVKGWLFYRRGEQPVPASLGLSERHCSGFWCALSELRAQDARAHRYAILPRLDWLAPARLDAAAALDHSSLLQSVQAHFENDSMPLLVALLEQEGDSLLEAERGFIVPDGWCERAGERIEDRGRRPASR